MEFPLARSGLPPSQRLTEAHPSLAQETASRTGDSVPVWNWVHLKKKCTSYSRSVAAQHAPG